MDKIEINKFLDDLLEDTPQGEWLRVEMAIRKKGDHWEAYVLNLTEDEMEKEKG